MSSSAVPDPLGAAVLASFRHSFTTYKALADRALAQLTDAEWLRVPAPGSNSAAVIVQHLVGNLRSRFTDFLTTDGEKPTRQRDREFEQPASVVEIPALRQDWDAAWRILFRLLAELQSGICCAPSPFGARRTRCWRPCSGKWPTTPATPANWCSWPKLSGARNFRA
ncbi:MAG TPA: DUF1572 family protein [Hymenobacter sp.]|jgi:hypothetical protein|uniref:DUF1572 family protein n=1 Tax=Hymenobacter sp. TaxID=1898978 RepID=UPI002EDADDF3